MREKRRWALSGGIAVFLAACAVWRPQLLDLVWRSLLDVAMPPVWGGLLAMLLSPPYHALCRRWATRPGHTCALLLCYLAVLGAVGGMALLLGPQLGRSILALGENSGEYASNLRRLLDALETRLPLPRSWETVKTDALQQLFTRMAAGLEKLFPHVLTATAGILKTLLQMLLGLFFSIYFLTDAPALAAQLKTAMQVWLAPPLYEHLLAFFALCRRMVYGWLYGQLLDSLILGAACAAGMALFGFAYPLLIGLLVCLMNMIPLIGGPLGGAAGFFLLLAIHPLQAAWFMVYYFVLEQLEGRFLYPRIVGSRLGLPPVLVLFAILCGSELGGLAGILLALPAAAVAYAAARSATRARQSLSRPNKENGENNQ